MMEVGNVTDHMLHLLHHTQNNMGPDREWLPSEEQAHWDRVSKCMEGLEKLRQQEPVAWSCDGGGEEADEDWATHDHSKVRRHIKSGGKCIKLYAAPVPAAVPEALTQEPLRGDEPIGPQASRADYVRGWNACRNTMLSAAPAAPAVPDVDWLSNVIRAADGATILGPGALAEKIVEAMQKGGATC